MPASPLANPTATREMLERFGLATKHRLGQNFLVDDHVIARILDLARLDEGSHVVEVGPGIGPLTLGMLPHAGSVVSIEADHTLEPVLADLAHEFPSFAYVMGDALKVSWEGVCAAGVGEGDTKIRVEPDILVATIILKYLAEHPSLAAAVVMVQAEVADRICAAPGSKAYGAYTAKLNLYGRVTGRFEVPPTCFMPAPHVNSAVVRIERASVADPETGAALGPERLAATAAVTDAAFAQRRKTIRNSMAARGFEKAALDEAFVAAGVSPTARAETLACEDFVRLASALAAAEAIPADLPVRFSAGGAGK